MLPGKGRFEALTGGLDPAARSEAADRCATLLVRGGHGTDDEGVVARVVHLAESEGLDTLAEIWSGAPADSLAGCLWRLYLLRSWVHADPVAAAREFDAGRAVTPVHEVVAGVVDPPGPDEVRRLTDLVLRGAVRGDFADTLYRAAAFARVVAAGRTQLGGWADGGSRTPYDSDMSAARLLTMAEQLEHAAGLELQGLLA
jgi:hypothetical protein